MHQIFHTRRRPGPTSVDTPDQMEHMFARTLEAVRVAFAAAAAQAAAQALAEGRPMQGSQAGALTTDLQQSAVFGFIRCTSL